MFARRQRETTFCGLQISGHEIRLAILRTSASGRQTVTLDAVSIPRDWTLDPLGEAIEQLRDRHGIKRMPIAVSLDGDYCVTRIHLGAPRVVDQGLAMLANRIPRYLSLGPGEKISGGFRQSLDKKTDYAVTAVANREKIERIQQTLRDLDMSPLSIEPTMVAVARELKNLVAEDVTSLLADGSGMQWDLGIVLDGRLLLDYRPSAARESERFGTILCEHMSRLHRFCERHRNQNHSDLNDLYIHGSSEKVESITDVLRSRSTLKIHVLTPDLLLPNYELPEGGNNPAWTGAVAAAITAADTYKGISVADLLSTVRTDRRRSMRYHLTWTFVPIAAAAMLLLFLRFVDLRERDREFELTQHQLATSEDLKKIQILMEGVRTYSVQIGNLDSIRRRLGNPNLCSQLLHEIPQSLPDAIKLNRLSMTSGGTLRITGTALDESVVYDAVSGLRRMHGVEDVLLQATNPSTDIQSEETEFAITVEMMVKDA